MLTYPCQPAYTRLLARGGWLLVEPGRAAVIVVADTGPLLAMAKVGALGLLRELYQQVITGPAFCIEAVTAGLAMNAADATLLNENYQRGELIVGRPALLQLPYLNRLHLGKEESIRLAIDLQAEWLLIDDSQHSPAPLLTGHGRYPRLRVARRAQS